MIEALVAILMQPREFSCSTIDPPSAVCCAEIKRALRDRRLSKATREVLGLYLAHKCKGAEYAQAEPPWEVPINCFETPGKGRWIYRIVGGRKCWFEADGLRRGREQPIERLRWPEIPPMSIIVPESPTTPSPGASGGFEQRWKGE